MYCYILKAYVACVYFEGTVLAEVTKDSFSQYGKSKILKSYISTACPCNIIIVTFVYDIAPPLR